ncbi:MAG: fumarylacetoacetate hydrolase family protein [Bacteroidales bacterium]
MKIIVLKENYNTLTFPEVYIVPDSAILKDGKPFFVPSFAEQFQFNTHLIVKIDRLGKNISKRFASRYYSQYSVGLTVTAHGEELSGAMVNAFDSSAIMGDFIAKEAADSGVIETYIDDKLIHSLDTSTMCNDIDAIIEHISKYFTLKIGDIIYTGYKADNLAELQINQTITAKIAGEEVLHFHTR